VQDEAEVHETAAMKLFCVALGLGLETIAQFGEAAAGLGEIPTIPRTPPKRRTEANVQDSVWNFETTILSSIPSPDAEGA
jgi:hypothetical protein